MVKEAKLSNESIIWNFLIKRFTRNQTAGIMGNLQQEHKFQTSDSPGGLGIAQWLGARREQLIQRGSYLKLDTQLNYLIWELEHTERRAYDLLRASYSVETATIAFQNYYERCGDCRQSQRIEYANQIIRRH